MATVPQLTSALREADKAGDTAAAQRIAEMLRKAATQPSGVLRDTGQGRVSSFASNVGRGVAGIVPNVVGGLGYLTGSEGLQESANEMEQGINRMLPTNPLYQGEFVQKAGNVIGQAGTTLATAGAGGALGKLLGGARAVSAGAQTGALAPAFLSGVREGGQQAEQYGIQGDKAYLRALLGGATELATEKLLFGMGTETAAVRKLLGESLEKGTGAFLKGVGSEAGEEAASQALGNLETKLLAPEGVKTPGVMEGTLEAAGLGAVGGGVFGGINAITGEPIEVVPSPTIEGDFMEVQQPVVPGAPPTDAVEESVSDLKVSDVIDPVVAPAVEAVAASVEANADVSPITAQIFQELLNEPVPETQTETEVAEETAQVVEPESVVADILPDNEEAESPLPAVLGTSPETLANPAAAENIQPPGPLGLSEVAGSTEVVLPDEILPTQEEIAAAEQTTAGVAEPTEALGTVEEEAVTEPDMQPAIERNRALLEQAAATLRGEGPRLPVSAAQVFGGQAQPQDVEIENEQIEQAREEPKDTESDEVLRSGGQSAVLRTPSVEGETTRADASGFRAMVPEITESQVSAQSRASASEEKRDVPPTQRLGSVEEPTVRRAVGERPTANQPVRFRREGNLIEGLYKGQDSSGRHIVDVNGRTEFVASVPQPLEQGPVRSVSFVPETTPTAEPQDPSEARIEAIGKTATATSDPRKAQIQVEKEVRATPALLRKRMAEDLGVANNIPDITTAIMEARSEPVRKSVRGVLKEAGRESQEGETLMSLSDSLSFDGISTRQAQAVIDQFSKTFPKSPKLKLVTKEQFYNDPEYQYVRDVSEQTTGKVSPVEAWVNADLDTIFLIPDFIRSQDRMRRVLIHEIVGHGGVRSIATAHEMQRIAQIIERNVPGLTEYVNKRYAGAPEDVQLQELLAAFSEMYNSADPTNIPEGWRKAWEAIKRIITGILKKVRGDINAFDDFDLHVFYTNAARSARDYGIGPALKNEIRLSLANFPGTPEAQAEVDREKEMGMEITKETEARFRSPDARNNRYLPVANQEMRSDAEAFLDKLPLREAVSKVLANDLPENLQMGADGRYNVTLAALLRRLTTAMDLTQDPYEVAQIRQMEMAVADRYRQHGTSEGRALQSRAAANADLAPIAPILAAERILIDRAGRVTDARFEGGTEGVTKRVRDKAKKSGEEASGNLADDLLGEDVDQTAERTEAEKLRDRSQDAAERIFQSLVRPKEEQTQRKNPVREVYRQHLKNPMEKAVFVARLTSLGVEQQTAETLFTTAADEIRGRETLKRLAEEQKASDKRQKIIGKDSPKLVELLNALRRKLYPGLNWRDIFEDLPEQQRQRQEEIFKRLRLDERLQGLTTEEAVDLTNELDKAWQRERRKVFLKELQREGIGERLPADRKKVEKALPRLLRAINLGTFGSEMFREAIAPEYGFKPIDQATAKDLRKKAEEAWKLPQGILRNQKMGELLDSLQKVTGSSRIELINNFWVASVLSGFATQFDTFMSAINGLGNNLLQSASIFSRGNPKEAFKAHAQWWQGLKQGGLESMRILAHGDYSVLKRFTTDLNKALEGESNFRPVPLGESLWRNGTTWQKYGMAPVMLWTGRLMAAADHINNTATSYGAMAAARALHPEIYGKAGAFTEVEKTAARQQAILEVTGGAPPVTSEEKATVSVRTREILSQLLKPEQQEEASFIGDQAAYQNDPIGLFGSVYSALNTGLGYLERSAEDASENQDINEVTRAALAILAGGLRGLTGTKFMRFGFNFGNDITQYIPGTYLLQQLAPVYGAQMSRSQQDLLLAKNVFGLMVASSIAALFLGKDDEDEGWHIEGNWSGLTPAQKSQLRSAGKEPLTLWKRKPDGSLERVSYRSWPTSGIFVAVGSMNDQKRYDPAQWSRTGVANHLLRAVTNGALQVKDTTALQGLTEILGASSFNTDPEQDFVSRLIKVPLKFEGGFIPTLLKDIDSWMDPRNFKPETALDEFMRNTPILRREVAGGRPMLNLLGEEVELNRTPWRRVYSESKEGEAYHVLGQLLSRGLSLPEPSTKRVVKVNGKDQSIESLGGKAEWEFARILGGKYKAFLEQEGPSLAAMDTERAQKRIRRVATLLGDQAEQELVRNLPK